MITRRNALLEVIGSITVLASCAGGQTSTNKGPEPPEFSLKIRAKQEKDKVGAEIRIIATLTNTSGGPLSLLVATNPEEAMSHFAAYVFDERGNPAVESKLGRRIRTGHDDDPNSKTSTIFVGSAPIQTLKPGESCDQEIILNRLCDLSKPGSYSAVLSMVGGNSHIRSNSISIVLTDPSDKNQ